MPRWAIFLIVFLLGGLTAVNLRRPAKQTVILEGIATASASIVREEEVAQVQRVIDGDTIELVDGRRVRYIGIDSPEMGNGRASTVCFALEATEENRRLVNGKTVRLEKDVSEADQYRRLLRYVYVDNVFVNEALVRHGYAAVATFPPDISHQELFLASEREARGQGRGLWNKCGNPTPLR